MFVRYFVEIPLPADVVSEALINSPDGWVPGLAERAEAHRLRLLADVGFRLADGMRVGKQVEIDIGQPFRFPSKTVLPIQWRAVGAEGLFPVMDADIEVAALGPSRTQLAISARYQPPLGSVGRAFDRALLHRVAEATVKDFLDSVATALPPLVRSGTGSAIPIGHRLEGPPP